MLILSYLFSWPTYTVELAYTFGIKFIDSGHGKLHVINRKLFSPQPYKESREIPSDLLISIT